MNKATSTACRALVECYEIAKKGKGRCASTIKFSNSTVEKEAAGYHLEVYEELMEAAMGGLRWTVKTNDDDEVQA